jgi:hypothetical protein
MVGLAAKAPERSITTVRSAIVHWCLMSHQKCIGSATGPPGFWIAQEVLRDAKSQRVSAAFF